MQNQELWALIQKKKLETVRYIFLRRCPPFLFHETAIAFLHGSTGVLPFQPRHRNISAHCFNRSEPADFIGRLHWYGPFYPGHSSGIPFHRLQYKSTLLESDFRFGYVLHIVLYQWQGHGGHEFQEAQAALGLNYSGHSMDWFFHNIIPCTCCTWFVTIRPGYKVIPRLLIGSVAHFSSLLRLSGSTK